MRPISDFMVQLGGGDREIVAELPPERSRFSQLGSVSLCVAAIAALAMFFVLHYTLQTASAYAVILGAFWGIVLLNIDRFLIVSTGAASARWQLAYLGLFRLLLAAGVTLISSPPLVMRIFAPEIAAQIRATNSGTGLIAQLHALSQLGGHDSVVTWTEDIIGVVFFVVSILPFLVTFMRRLGPRSLYDTLADERSAAMMRIAARALEQREDLAALERDQALRIAGMRREQTLKLAEAETEAELSIKEDMLRRERGVRVEANKRFSAETRAHIMASIDDWSSKIRDSVSGSIRDAGEDDTQATPEPPPIQELGPSGYELPDGERLLRFGSALGVT